MSTKTKPTQESASEPMKTLREFAADEESGDDPEEIAEGFF
ncbi:MAG: hypothetical protein Q8O15_10555 [Rectinemataceae bacterium]|nr:hypothetical protein [Rectinemataceae bacterium]